MSNPDETNDPARIVADEANSERAKARRVMDAGELYMIGTPDDMATGSNMVMLEPPMNGEDVRLVRKRVDDMRDYWDSSDVTTLMADCDGALDTIEHLRAENAALRAESAGLREIIAATATGQLVVMSNRQITVDGKEYPILYPFTDTPTTRSEGPQRNDN